jgi:hypothetical protein
VLWLSGSVEEEESVHRANGEEVLEVVESVADVVVRSSVGGEQFE